MPYLHSKSFESRTAASVALSQIFTLIPVWLPSCERDTSAPIPNISESLSPPEFPVFSIQELVTQGTLLLASSGKEFVKPTGILSSSQEVKKARKAAIDRLGLGFLEGVEDNLDLDKEFAAEMEVDISANPPGCDVEADVPMSSPMDLCPPEVPVAKAPSPSTRSVTPNLPSPSAPAVPSESDAILSARERNRLKRKRKPGNSAFVAAPPPQTTGARYAPASSGSNKYKIKFSYRIYFHTLCRARLVNADEKAVSNSRLSSPSPASNGTANDKVIIDPSKGGAISPKVAKESKALEVESGFWVWDGITRVLEVDLFSAAWEVRHGAAMAMRELLKAQGRCGGMRGPYCSFPPFPLLNVPR